MGIKGLKSLINKYAPGAISDITLKDLSGKTVCIDSSILLYKYKHIYSGDNFHILGFLHKILELQSYNIKGIFVFDGKPPEAKCETLRKRRVQLDKRKEQLLLLKSEFIAPEFINSDSETEPETPEKTKKVQLIASLEKSVKPVTKQHSLEIIELLKSLGIPFFISETEAEKTCAYLQIHGYADYILTEDTDSLTFGGQFVIFSKKNVFSLCELDKVLEGMDLIFSEFVDLCILCGCDYTGTIPKVGPITAFNLIKKFRSIEKLPNVLPDSFEYLLARQLFKQEPISVEFKETEKNQAAFSALLSRWNLNYFNGKFNFCQFKFN
jgi:flap endonuclease-1